MGLGGGPANRPGVPGGARPPRLHLFDSGERSAWTFHHHLSRPRQTSLRAKTFDRTACRHRMYSLQPTHSTRSWRKSKSSEETRPDPVTWGGRGTIPDRVKRRAEIKRTGGRIGSSRRGSLRCPASRVTLNHSPTLTGGRGLTGDWRLETLGTQLTTPRGVEPVQTPC